MESNNNLGIPDNGDLYHLISKDQQLISELTKSYKFLKNDFVNFLKIELPNLVTDHLELQFINYGDTQLVYVLHSNENKYAVLMGQPVAEYGIVKREFENLKRLKALDKDLVVSPLGYFGNGERELYIAPYSYQARCIASQNKGWGIFIPEPSYRFEVFTREEEKVVNQSIIAILIKLYDEKRKLGLASCKVGGGDFILEKEWSTSSKTLEKTLKYLKLIAARELIEIDLEKYIEQIRIEFLKPTYYRNLSERDESVIINHKCRLPMNIEDIENGIRLGKKFRK